MLGTMILKDSMKGLDKFISAVHEGKTHKKHFKNLQKFTKNHKKFFF